VITFPITASRREFFEEALRTGQCVRCEEGCGYVKEVTQEGFSKDGPVLFVKFDKLIFLDEKLCSMDARLL